SSNVQKINERVKVISVGNSDVDINLPVTKSKNENAYAVVIGNKDYKNIKGKDVDFAINDAVMIKKYLVDVMGFMPGNVIYRENAAKGDFEAIFGTRENYKAELYELVKNPNAEVFIYYSGHGAPSQYDKKSYLVPVECKPNNVQFGGYPTELLYGNLAKIRTKFTTVIIDACYSGNIYENISPLGIPVEETKVELPNGAVITATSSNETANWYPEQQHGMFTYFFLKALQNPQKTDKNTDNKVTLDEVYDFVNDHNAGVPYQARLIGQQQNPNIKGNAKDKIVIEY
ncbi:MAG: caspase domain-containing protein, partial [Bacteroidota bacterium]